MIVSEAIRPPVLLRVNENFTEWLKYMARIMTNDAMIKKNKGASEVGL